MPEDLKRVRTGSRPVPPPWPLLGESEYSSQIREVPEATVWDGLGRHARRPIIPNDFQNRGRRGDTDIIERSIWATGGPPWFRLGIRGKEPNIL